MEDERVAQTSYWRKHSQQPTYESMMLDSRAQELDQYDRPEVSDLPPASVPSLEWRACQVLRALGSVKDKAVLELGAGIGRFTGELAQQAAHVTANDFMPSLVEQNRKTNDHQGNITFVTQDATTLNYDELSVDVVFSNWLLMYLSDEEMEKLLHKILRWVRSCKIDVTDDLRVFARAWAVERWRCVFLPGIVLSSCRGLEALRESNTLSRRRLVLCNAGSCFVQER